MAENFVTLFTPKVTVESLCGCGACACLEQVASLRAARQAHALIQFL